MNAETTRLTTTENRDHSDAESRAVCVCPPTIRRRIASKGNRRRAEQDQDRLERGREVLNLLVPVAVALVGRLISDPHGQVRDHRGDQVDARVHRLGQDRDRPVSVPATTFSRISAEFDATESMAILCFIGPRAPLDTTARTPATPRRDG